jgi:D-3-phosphoglycerate dehydrogenase
VALLNFDELGAPLADKEEIDRVFKWRNLEPLWVEKAEHFPGDASVLITTGTPVGSELLAKAPELKLVAVASEGYGHVDVDACKARGIAVVNVPGYSTDATAELALSFVLAHLRNLAACQKTLDEGFWTLPSQDKLSSKTVGLVGVGSLGLRLAELFNAFGVKALLGYSPTETAAFTELGGTYLVSLEELFRRSDVVCICCPFSPETKGLVSESLLELLSPSSVLVNVAHGGVIDEDALGRLLARGRFRAGLDVFATEPLPVNSSLRHMAAERLLTTPHVGYQTVECLEKRFDVTTKNILAFQLDQPLNRVA